MEDTRERPYPVIDPNPPIGKIIANFSPKDMMFTAAVTAVACSFIAIRRGPMSPMRTPTVVYTGLTGGLFGFCYCCQSSFFRLTGLRR